MKNAQEMCQELYGLTEEKIKLESQLTELNKRINQLKSEANQQMFEEGVDEITIKGVAFKPHQEVQFSLTDGSKSWVESPNFRAWLADNKLDDLVRTREEIHHATRDKVLRQALVEGEKKERELSYPDFVKVSFFDTVKFSENKIEASLNAGA